MTSPIETTAIDQMAAEDNAEMLERVPVPAEPLPIENPQPAVPAEDWYPGATVVESPVEEPEVVDQGEAEPEVMDEGEAEPEVTDEGEAETSIALSVPDAEPESIPDSPVASVTASLNTRWHEIQAMFVDDPRSSAESAAVLVDDCVQALVASVREQQDSLLAAWHAENAGTEELRAAVQHYRGFGNRLADFTREI